MIKNSFYEKTARERIAALCDAGSFVEILKPASIAKSPHLTSLGITGSFDDGVIIGTASMNGQPAHVIAQEGQFMGGAVGEIHGAKITGLLLKAIADGSSAVILLADSGGVRLHEANAGLIAISEIMRAMLQVRQADIPVITVIGGICGAFGGMGISSCLSSHIIMNEEGRLALSGPEVIETVKGVAEFDAKDRALVWRVTGGKHRYLMGHADTLVEDDIEQMRAAIVHAMSLPVVALDLATLQQAQHELHAQQDTWFGQKDGRDIWAGMGIADADKIPMLSAAAVTKLKAELTKENHA
ncbi:MULTISPECIES: biotin-independent malonate decarboxylase subunit beta [Moraxella]|uniref:Malonate decarboxylase beta subunit n=1 Tax=Moraxella catarrhalis TaxID=480 RepID=A0A7Z0UZJ2_MORCA|nr:biotin-independent malonate decarboxylase subunit beta [Moraxella catarrhalis]OAV01591.1 Malonate decarboxylase beta subunit [Moraxella catarrhalis]STY82675.1 Methylmalonyl-CoA carboxyltransferase 12S subunit [Moraxella catarrhalis]